MIKTQPQIETAELPKSPSLVPLLLEMRSEGMSLGKISQLIGIPKSTQIANLAGFQRARRRPLS